MVDITSLDVAAFGTFTRLHNYTKNIETAHLGKLYSSTLDTLDHYVIESVAKPVLSKAPEWVSDNRVVTAIRGHQGISIAVGAALTLISLVSLWIWLHPAGTTVKSKGTGSPETTPPTSDDEGDGTDSVNGDGNDVFLDPTLDDDGSKTSGTAGDGKETKTTGGERSEGDEDPFAEGPVDSRDARKTYNESSATASADGEGARKNLNSLFTTAGTGGGVTDSTTVSGTDDFDDLLKEVQDSRTGGDTQHKQPPQADTTSNASVVTGGGIKSSAPTHRRPSDEPVWLSTAGYGSGFSPGSKSTGNGSKTAVVDETTRSGGKKKKKSRGKGKK